MTASVISPKPGFDWNLVQWGGPNQPRTEHCSYCGNPFPTTTRTTALCR